MLKRIVLLAAVAIVALMNSAMAFDGNRRGFVLGGGAGFSPNASWQSDAPGEPEDNGAGTGLNVFIGYAWDRANMIGFEANLATYDSDINSGRASVYQGFRGISWYHYFGEEGHSFFTVAGLGLYAFVYGNCDNDNDGSNDQGGGVLAGGGYEFIKHWQVGVYASGGRTKTPRYDYDHTHVNLLVNGMVF
jgi:hypothetical protein